MKILHIDDRFTPQGGVGQYILELSALLETGDHHSALAYGSAVGEQSLPIPSYLLPDNAVQAIDQVRTIIAQEHPDVLMAHQVSSPDLMRALVDLMPTVAYVHGFAMVCPGLAKSFRRGERVCTQRSDWRCFVQNYVQRCSGARNPLTMARMMRNSAALKSAYHRVDHIMVASRYMRDLLLQNGFLSKHISVVSPHFVYETDALPYKAPENRDMLLYVGRLEREKGLPHLLSAMRFLPESARLTVAGDGTELVTLEQLAYTLGVGDRVGFAGWQDSAQLAALYLRCAVVVVPSVWPEPFGKVGVEAMVHGRPVVAFDVGGISQWLTDGITGRLVPGGDAAELAGAIAGLLADPGMCEQLGRNGQRYVFDSLTAESHLEDVVAVLRSAISARGKSAGVEV